MKLKINQVDLEINIFVVLNVEFKKHDADLTKQFNKDCAKTGGGPGPTQPEGC